MRTAVCFVAWGLTLALAAPAAGDCECFPFVSTGAARDRVEFVFRGRVERVVRASRTGCEAYLAKSRSSPGYGDIVKNARACGSIASMRVDAVWKGEPEPVVRVMTPTPDECGITFTEGASYLVYAVPMRTGPELFTVVCWRTSTASSAQGDIRALGPPRAP